MTKKTGASFARHKSNPNRGTPPEFIQAVVARFGFITVDLAATVKNRVVTKFHGPGSEWAQDTFTVDWSTLDGRLWLNPPFDRLPSFADKFAAECRNRKHFSFFLAPAATGSNWFQRVIVPNSYVLELEDRITFIGESQPYPKDMILAVAGFCLVGRASWHWDSNKTKAYSRVKKAKTIPKKLLAKYAAAGFAPAGNGLWMPIASASAAPAAVGG